MKAKFLLILIMLAIVSLTGCSSSSSSSLPAGSTGKMELTREDAKNAILKFYKDNGEGDLKQETYLRIDENKDGDVIYKAWNSDSMYGLLSEFQKKGLVDITEDKKEGEAYKWYKKYKITDLGKKYLSENGDKSYFTVREFEDIEVTGLTAPSEAMGVKSISAEYIKKSKLTPFGEAYGRMKNEDIKLTIQFVLFDDGWRISN